MFSLECVEFFLSAGCGKKYNGTFEKALKSFKPIQSYERELEKWSKGVRVNVGKPIRTRSKKRQNIKQSTKKVVNADVVRWHRIYIFIQKEMCSYDCDFGGPSSHLLSIAKERCHNHRRFGVLCRVYICAHKITTQYYLLALICHAIKHGFHQVITFLAWKAFC